ncbi:MAG: transporter, permease protein [Subtercola sp.]|jgi:multiple sugar transport system permease protein|nr:transporter, permease protein [Subtercola sp.]
MSLSSPSGRGVRLTSNAVLLLIALTFIAPLVWLVLASLNSTASLSAELPGTPTLDNFAQVLTPALSFVPLWNSFLISAGSALITVVVAILAAYPLSRFKTRFNKPFLYGVLFATGLPITAMMVPVYSLFVRIGLVDSLLGTIFFMATSSLPIAIWMTKNFVDGVPTSLEEAAWMDGASSMRTLRSVVVPLMRPGIAVVFIYVFIHSWGNFFVPFVLLLSPEKQPASVSIYTFFGENGAIAYGQLAAYSLVYSIPVLVLYVIISRGVGGSSALAGAVKG